MKSPEQLHKELTDKLINENYVDLNPITTFEASPKADFETKFADFLTEKKGDLEELKPIVNTEEKFNTKEELDKIPAESKAKPQGEGFQISYKVDKTLENIDSHNYDYNPSVENINNVNGEELLKGFYCEMKNNPDMTKVEIQEKVIKNLAKDPLFYVKEGQFGVEGLGYTEQKISQNDGKNYGGSGYSDKLKDSSNNMEIVKESIGGVVTTGTNPWTVIIDEIIGEEKELPMDEVNAVDARQEAIDASNESAGVEEEKRPDYPDVDKDGDREESMEKALKDKKAKKPKKESIDTKLSEIGKAGDITKLEAQLEFLSNHINEKIDRVSSINEDDNLKELIDKKKMKDMQKEIKLLEKRKGKMEKMYEKMCGKKYKQMVDEDLDDLNDDEYDDGPDGKFVK
jgi:hypothetical protein